jgi:hypothetical protein
VKTAGGAGLGHEAGAIEAPALLAARPFRVADVGVGPGQQPVAVLRIMRSAGGAYGAAEVECGDQAEAFRALRPARAEAAGRGP